ncbi:MAG: hypothetical protein ACRCS5_10505 [Sphingomonas sp.]|jgi:hypothetical protein|nr:MULTISPECIES: hypothetical protein [unclassified Sphingomonas]MDR6847672.1 uncharacterized protein YneF (UPF0154 family) [Sphingomonas sp. BE137]MDR7257703.1 uncharacterized protein YneF (UPF0154 family) [Sphingomonas sp. BE270]
MSRSLVILLVIVVVLVGVLFGLSSIAREKPLKHVEKAVPLANLQK